ncbi:MAG: glycosyltransferase [Bacteroidota bacterium]
MTITEIILLSLISASVYIDLIILLFSVFIPENRRDKKHSLLPDITILIVSRNEKDYIKSCLEGLENLDYPKEKIQIVIGDDESTDGTLDLIESYLSITPNSIIKSFNNIPTGLNPKAYILNELISLSTGEYLFFTDANAVVPRNWVKTLLKGFDNTTGLVNGISLPRGKENLFTSLQQCEWIFSQSLISSLGQIGFPSTAYGHNMCVSKEAYLNSGGFGKELKDLTEDFTLSKNIYKQKYNIRFLRSKDTLVFKPAMQKLSKLIHQRLRWFTGAIKLPIWLVILNLLRWALFPLSLVYIFLFDIYLGLGALTIRILINITLIKRASRKLKFNASLVGIILYELYYFAVILTILIAQFLRFKINWSERKY